MGTRGLIRIITNSRKIIQYNHWDSYPRGLGNKLVTNLTTMFKKKGISKVADKFDKIVLVDKDIKPTIEQINKLKKYSDLTVSDQSYEDWYCLLRKCQGSLPDIMKSGHALNAKDEVSIWIEYTYTIDFVMNQFICAAYNFDKGQNEILFQISLQSILDEDYDSELFN